MKKETARVSTWVPSEEPEENDVLDNDDDMSILDLDYGTEARDEFVANLNLTHTPEQRDKIMAGIDKIILDTKRMLADDQISQENQ